VLLDGRRLGGAGNKGDFVDLSLLPTIAVGRVEVMLDGASALYGSDAVGGVVNIRMRRDVDGGEVRLRGGTSPAGGASEAQIGVLVGRTWSTGNVLLAYEGYERGRLTAQSRSYTRSADLRPFGGSDFRSTNAFPGNVVGVNPATGVSGPHFGILPGQNGIGLTPASFKAGAVNLTDPQQGIDILPDQRRRSLYGAFRQDLTDRLEVSGDATYSDRLATARIGASTATFTVGRANPFFVSPNGATTNSIAYSFAGELPPPRVEGSADTFSATLGARLRAGRDWNVDSYAGYAEETDQSVSSGFVNTAILAEALGNVADNRATAYSAARDGFFNPFTGLAANPASVTGPLGSGASSTTGKTDLYTANVQADGPVLHLPGGDAKLALGANIRREGFRRTGTNFLSTATPTPQAPVSGERTVKALFAEVLVPLVGPENGVRGVRTFDLSGALRWEDYSDFGRTLNPKLGIVWGLNDEVRLRATYGESFRAPGLGDLHSAQIFQAINFPLGATRLLSLALTGGNPDLKPETAKSWTLTADYAPAWASGLHLSASWFNVDFKSRVDRPVQQNVAGALSDPRFVDFVRRISPAANPADLALVNAVLAEQAADGIRGLNPPSAYGAIVDIRAVNSSALEVEGLDLQATYQREAWGGRLSAGLNASRLFRYEQSLTPTTAPFDLVGLATYPAKLRGRATLDWSRDRFGLGTALNYIAAFHDTTGARIESQTTLDLQVRLIPPKPFTNTTLLLTVRNAFDTGPPFYNNPLGYAFDPGNADPIGRFVALQLSKTW
jgi:iron complex outermembrane receptor protein